MIKNLVVFFAFLLMFTTTAVAQTPGYSLEEIASCKLGVDASQSVRVLRGHKISDTHVYYLETSKGLRRINSVQEDEGKKSGRWDDDELEDLSRGSDGEVFVHCAGNPEQVLVVSGLTFSSAYLKSFIIRYNSKIAQWEEFVVAERGRPAWIYLKPDRMKVVLPNIAHGSQTKYLVEEYVSGKGLIIGKDGRNETDTLPDPKGYEVITIKEHQE